MTETFTIEPAQFDPVNRRATFTYRLAELSFTETVDFPEGDDANAHRHPAFERLLGLTALVLGVSYFKLRAPFVIACPEIPLNDVQRLFVLDVYENGLGEFYARNDLKRFGRITLSAPARDDVPTPAPALNSRLLLPIGGGKDSLVSVQLLEAAGIAFTPFAVNPKGPILTSVAAIGAPPFYLTRRLDAEMIRLGTQPGYYNGHVPSTAINSMLAALTAVLHGHDGVVLSNERSASEGNMEFDGREANHQHSKSLGFEVRIADILADATGGALSYYSLLRPFSEARIAGLFARQTRFDTVFSSCNRNFRLSGHDGPLWCGECPKCHFVFLILAPAMERERLIGIFGADLLDRPENETSFRELTGLAGQKPWECVGEILEAAACLHRLSTQPEWRERAIVSKLLPDLLNQYGRPALESAHEELMRDSADHHLPPAIAHRVLPHAS